MAKVGEHPNTARVPWTQALVNARWLEIGNPGGIAPLLPSTMSGWVTLATRGPRMLALSPTGKMKKDTARSVTKEENAFLNFYNKVAVDPYRKQSGISKVAGGLLQVAELVFPPLAAMSAVAQAGNTVLDVTKMKRDLSQATAQLTMAAEAAYAAVPPAPVALLAPPAALAPLVIPPPPPALPPATPARVVAGRVVRKLSQRDGMIMAGMFGVGLYLLTRK